MSGRWAACLPREAAGALGRLRLVPGLTVHEDGDTVWLQGDGLDEALEPVVRGLPGARRFAVLPDRQLVAAGTRVPFDYLPEGPWHSLPEWLAVTLDGAGLAGRVEARVPIRLERSGAVLEENVLLTSLAGWVSYGEEAPQVRLERWAFAVSDDGRAVVRGQPLPPLPGERFVEQEGVAVPAGWAWDPPVEAAVLRAVLGLEAGDLALLHPDGTWDRVAAGNFTRASRSAIRQSAGAPSDA
jgi:hypothetical protein